MIKQFAQRTRQTNATRLFAVNAIQRVRNKYVDCSAQPNPFGYRCRTVLTRTGLEIPIIVGEQHQIHHAKQEAQKGHQIRRKPAREELHEQRTRTLL